MDRRSKAHCIALFLATAAAAFAGTHAAGDEPSYPRNLLLNPGFGFQALTNSREGKTDTWHSGSVACWNQQAYGDIDVNRAPHAGFHTALPVENVVAIQPGKRFYQLALLAELGLDNGDPLSLSVRGHQTSPGTLQAAIRMMRLDSQPGEWQPSDDKRTFLKQARGDLIPAAAYTALSDKSTDFRLTIENARVAGAIPGKPGVPGEEANAIALVVEFTNVSKDQMVWIYAPCLARSATPLETLPEARAMPTEYRGIPRTIQKLRRGDPLHIIIMGSSIDRGSANPRMYLYDEDPQSPTYKQPKGTRTFDGSLIGRPDWDDYIGWWQHYFMYGGVLRRLLMEKFDYPINKLLLNTMASDGSSISEAHSGLADYASLSLPPVPEVNGHRAGRTWQELYPALFDRPEGPRPDLVIFGSGANEKVDGAQEIALFEGAIRWFQHHSPGVEFLFCQWDASETYTASPGFLKELALRYQIPFLDFARTVHLAARYCDPYTLSPRDGHPQAAAHYLWAKHIERAFDVGDSLASGVAQLALPERINPYTIGWEGEVHTYGWDASRTRSAPDPRIRDRRSMILDDTVVNLWATTKDKELQIRVDSAPHLGSRRLSMPRRDLRNSSFATGRLSLGDRHVLEIDGNAATLVAVDCKTVNDRTWFGVQSPRWDLGGQGVVEFASEWGAPFGNQQVVIAPDHPVTIDVLGTDLSIAYVDRPEAGALVAEVDGRQAWQQATDVPFASASGTPVFMENRKAILHLPYGQHQVRLSAKDRPVALLGIFTYDTRSNRSGERVVRGLAAPGETIHFTPPFAARPFVTCTGGLRYSANGLSPASLTFTGTEPGQFEAVGEGYEDRSSKKPEAP